MISLWSLLTVFHLVGLALGIGSATVKVVLLLRSIRDVTLLPVYLRVVRPITHLLILGLILMTLSGIGWMLLGYGFQPRLVVKLVLVGVIWIMGPIIDNVVEPRFRKLAVPEEGSFSQAFFSVRTQYMVLEVTATALFYIVLVLGILL